MRPAEVLRELFARIADGRWDELGALYADDVVVIDPFAPDGPRRTTGRAAVVAFFAATATRVASLRAEDVVLWETTDPEVVVAQFVYRGVGHDGVGFTMPCVFVTRVRDGVVVETHDHTGPRRPAP